MIPGYVGCGVLPFDDLFDEDESATKSHERALLRDPEADLFFLATVTPSGGVPVRVSDVTYATEPTDTPASTPWDTRLLSPYNVEVRIPPPDAGQAVGSLVFGLVEIEDGDRELDALLSESWEGRELEVDVLGTYDVGLATEHRNAYAERVQRLRGTVDHVGWESGRLVLTLREVHQGLAQPLQANTYGGTGGADGGDAIAGQRKPLAYGDVFNAAPVLVHPGKLIYQVHDPEDPGELVAIDAVRDSGVDLVFHADFADFAALEAWSVTVPGADEGKFSTCLAGGYVRLAAQPLGLVTVDSRGDVSDTASIAKRIALRAGLDDPGDFEGSSFGGFPTTSAVGYYTGGREVTALDALGELLSGIDGWISDNPKGRLRIGRYVDPGATAEAAVITDEQLVEITAETEIPPAWRVEVRYGANWSPQDKDGLAGAVTAENRELYSQPYRVSALEDASVKATHRDARVHVVSSFLRNKVDADALSAEVLSRLKVRRQTYRAVPERQLFQRLPGHVVRVVSEDAGLSAGKNLFLYGLAEVASERSNTWELWG